MMKLDQRGTAAFEFCMVAVPLFMMMFAIFDLGRYAITMQSLRALAGAGARAMMVQCYTPAAAGITPNRSPSSCTGNYLSATQMQNVAPFLFHNGSPAPTLSTNAGAAELTVTASQAFKMLMPIWGGKLNSPSASTKIPL
jgi:Flp pilus assembly protein TadG